MRLIDADEAVELLSEWDWQELYLPCHFKELILDVCDTVDAEPARHGHWWLERNPDGTPCCFHCSVCDHDGHCIGNIVASDYCPDCGARMDEEAPHVDP